MSTGANRPPNAGGSVSPPLALVFATAAFLALIIGGIGVLSLVSGHDPIVAASFGQLPGIIGPALATLAFAATLWVIVRRPRPPHSSAFVVAIVVFLVYLIGVGLGGLLATSDFVLALAAIARLIVDGFAVLVAVCALLCGWGGIVLVRNRGGRPRWPWERDDEP